MYTWNKTIGIFWDYENVPLRHKDYSGFLDALVNYYNAHTIAYAKIYARDRTMSDRDYELIEERHIFQFKFVEHNDKNAVDYVMMQSCLDVLRNKEEINHVLLLTGDGDFSDLADDLLDWKVTITLICQQQNVSSELLEYINKAYSVNLIAQNSSNWWLY